MEHFHIINKENIDKNKKIFLNIVLNDNFDLILINTIFLNKTYLFLYMIELYNSLTKKKETFKPLKDKEVKIYSCGPTIYNYVHIGNLRAYVFNDILIKTLKYFGYAVTDVMNLTDVDDKTINGSYSLKSDAKTSIDKLKDFTSTYERAFFDDILELNIERPKIIAKATESIKDMELLIQKLYDKGFAYISEDGIYFDVSKNKKYGQLVEIDADKQQYNKDNRVVSDEYEKDNVQDFALWKFSKDEDEPSWTIKIGNEEYEGRPGWHIECSAMAHKNLGEQFDIHTGGVDLKFPHHENEIAQSSCALDKYKVNYWIHNEHLLVDGKKMSKSSGNFYTLRDLKSKGNNALAIREVFLRSHYRQQLNFTIVSLEAGEVNVDKINEFYQKLQILKPNSTTYHLSNSFDEKIEMFEKALCDDLNTTVALSGVYEFMNDFNRLKEISKDDIEIAIKFMDKTNSVLGLICDEEEVPFEVHELARERKIARDKKDWGESDKLRDEIYDLGYEIKDYANTQEGFIITRIKGKKDV